MSIDFGGGGNVEELNAKVSLDTAKAQAESKAMGKSLDEVAEDRHGTIRITEHDDTKKARKSVKDLGDGLDGVQESTEGVTSALSKTASAGGGLGQIVTNLGGIISGGLSAGASAAGYAAIGGAIAGLVAGLAPLAGLAAVLLPMLTALAAVGTALMASFQGVTEAVEAQSKAMEAQKLSASEALQNARAREQAYHSLQMATRNLTEAQKALQEALTPADQLDTAVAALALRSANLEAANAAANLAKEQENADKKLKATADSMRVITSATDEFSGKTVEFVTKRGTEQSGQGESPADKARQHEAALIRVEAAALAIARAQEHINDLQKKGTEADPAVEAARQRVADATYNVKQAQDALNQVTTEGNAKAIQANEELATAMSKLAPAAQQFVDFFVGTLKPMWDEISKNTQAGFFPGLMKGIQAAMPLLRMFGDWVSKAGGMMGDILAKVGEWLGRQDIMDMFNRVMDTGMKLLESFAGSGLRFAEALLRIADAARPLTDFFGEWVRQIADMLLTWLQSEEGQKSMAEFFEATKQVLMTLTPLLPGLVKAFADLMKALSGVGLEFVAELLRQITVLLKDPEVIKAISNIIQGMTNLLPVMAQLAMIGAGLFNTVYDLFKSLKDGGGPLENFKRGLDQIVKAADMLGVPLTTIYNGLQFLWDILQNVWTAITDFWTVLSQDRAWTDFKNGLGLIKDFFIDVINFIIRAWNALDFSIDITVPDWVPGFGGKSFKVDDVFPDISEVANVKQSAYGYHGMVDKPTLFMAGEGGQPEHVSVTPASGAGATGGNVAGGGAMIGSIIFNEKVNPMHVAQEIAWRVRG